MAAMDTEADVWDGRLFLSPASASLLPGLDFGLGSGGVGGGVSNSNVDASGSGSGAGNGNSGFMGMDEQGEPYGLLNAAEQRAFDDFLNGLVGLDPPSAAASNLTMHSFEPFQSFQPLSQSLAPQDSKTSQASQASQASQQPFLLSHLQSLSDHSPSASSLQSQQQQQQQQQNQNQNMSISDAQPRSLHAFSSTQSIYPMQLPLSQIFPELPFTLTTPSLSSVARPSPSTPISINQNRKRPFDNAYGNAHPVALPKVSTTSATAIAFQALSAPACTSAPPDLLSASSFASSTAGHNQVAQTSNSNSLLGSQIPKGQQRLHHETVFSAPPHSTSIDCDDDDQNNGMEAQSSFMLNSRNQNSPESPDFVQTSQALDPQKLKSAAEQLHILQGMDQNQNHQQAQQQQHQHIAKKPASDSAVSTSNSRRKSAATSKSTAAPMTNVAATATAAASFTTPAKRPTARAASRRSAKSVKSEMLLSSSLADLDDAAQTSASHTPQSAERSQAVSLDADDGTLSPNDEDAKEAHKAGRGKRRMAKRELLTEDEKRFNHVMSEQKRRNLLRIGFQTITDITPVFNEKRPIFPTGPGNVGSSGNTHSKSSVLFRVADYIRELQAQVAALSSELRSANSALALPPDAVDRLLLKASAEAAAESKKINETLEA